MNRFLQINGKELKRIRLVRGWSQAELAKRAGYSERLVRKAETGGTLELDTIANLAEALSIRGETVSHKNLLVDYLSLAKLFVESYDDLGPEMLPAIENVLADDFVFHVAGDPAAAPFVGDWVGKQGYAKFLELFFGSVSRHRSSLEVTYTVGDAVATARYVDTLFVPDQPKVVLWVNLHFTFKDGLIARIEDQYDTATASKTPIQR